MPMPSACASFAERKFTRSPRKKISPEVGFSAPLSIFMSVDLPAPFSPATAWISPSASEKQAPSLAATPFG